MLIINQGGNTPITFNLSAPLQATKLEASLYHPAIPEIKHWSISDVLITNDSIVLPISEDESLDFPVGNCKLSVKALDYNDIIVFYNEEDVKIKFKFDKTELQGSGEEHYEGVYVVTPSRSQQVLETKNKIMDDDVTVKETPYYEVINEAGGYTFTIC